MVRIFPINALLAILAVMVSVLGGSCALADDKFTPDQLDFFESQIRPVLVANCLECHGAEKSESGLRLDSRDAILKGGESGAPVVLAGKPNESLLIQSIRYTGDYEMPPNEKLADGEINDMVRWVEMGMPWPKDAKIAKLTGEELVKQHRANHWAFHNVKSPKIPDLKTKSGFAIDKLIQKRLANRKLTPSPRAGKATLIRRAYFDLTGLPPSYRQVQEFVNDKDPLAYSKLIDELLESQHYGERWARHWLDVARYADTSGYKLDSADRRYPFAFTYRDYVIDAFNKDLPYDQFIREQLAADYLEVPEDKHTLAAMGFITVGRQYLGRPDTIDDQVDVVTRGLMGLTVACARCHDHKYDAIPTEDYYSIYGVFNNNTIPDELPLIGKPENIAQFKEYFEELDKLKSGIGVYRSQRYADFEKHLHEYIVDYMARVFAPDQEELIQKQDYIKLIDTQLRPVLLDKWRGFLADRLKPNRAELLPSIELLKLPNENFAENAQKLIDHWVESGKPKLSRIVLKALQDDVPQNKIEIGKVYGQLFKTIVDKWKAGGAKVPAVDQFKGEEKKLARMLFSRFSPIELKANELDRFLTIPERKEFKKLKAELVKFNSNAPDGITRAMVLKDKEQLVNQSVMLRGNPRSRGDLVPRQFVALLSEPERHSFKNKSGRLELAEKIASSDNPLTARVFVNRVWMHHFSRPIVDTPSDFGIRCEAPLQQDVLDFLARDFMDHGWSIKRLHRQIMLSDTYCQSSNGRPECSKVDPENRLYWKMNRRRLEFEPLRDSLLAVGGDLDRSLHGKSVDLQKRPFSKRRTIYGFIDRQDLPGLFRVFDLASPDQSAAKRIRTTVPQQSLFMLNSAFVMERARRVVQSAPGFVEGNRSDKITALYRAVYQRNPSAKEIQIGIQYVDAAISEDSSKPLFEKGDDSIEARKSRRQLGVWQRYAQLLICANEFEFVD